MGRGLSVQLSPASAHRMETFLLPFPGANALQSTSEPAETSQQVLPRLTGSHAKYLLNKSTAMYFPPCFPESHAGKYNFPHWEQALPGSFPGNFASEAPQ